MRLHIATCPTKKAQSESLALGWTPACNAQQGGSMGRLLKRKRGDSQSEFSSPDVGCVCLVFFFQKRGQDKERSIIKNTNKYTQCVASSAATSAQL